MSVRAPLILLALALASGPALPVPASAQGDPTRYDIGTPTLSDVWVDPVAGNDANTGNSRAAALRNLSAAWARVPMGTTLSGTGWRIRLVAGTYPESGVPGYWESRWGTAQFPVIVEAADGAGTARLPSLNIVDCRYLYLVGLHVEAGGGDVLHCERCDHFLLRETTVRGRAPGTYAVQETVKINQSSHVYIEDSDVSGAWDNAIDNVAVQYGHVRGNRIHDAGDWCMYLKGGSAYFVVEGNEVFDCGTGGLTAGQGTGFEYMVSPWLHYEAYDIRFVNNLVHDTEGAGLGVNGGYDILMAHNTLYRVGSRSHALEFVFGGRTCDEQTSVCEANRVSGGWGTSSGGDQPIGNRNVFLYDNVVYNPAGFRSQWQHFTIDGPRTPSSGSNIPTPARTDVNLQIRGNVIWNGPVGLSLGLGGSTGCQDSNPTCNTAQILADNDVNEFEPQLVDPAAGDFRPVPGGNLFSASSFPIPSFPGGDRPSPPSSPAGGLANVVAWDWDGVLRGGSNLPGAFAGIDCSAASCGDGTVTPDCEVCDDGNTTSGDGCDANCTPTACGNGVVAGAETCDDGNTTSGDGCDATCTPTACGNLVTTAGEQCDDGNAVPGDGCSASCRLECLPSPRSSCRRPTAAGKSVLQLANSPEEARDKLLWIWGSGAETTREEFGSPDEAGGASYRFCVYDQAGATQRLVVDVGVAAGVGAGGAGGACGAPTCWRGSRRGFRYAAVPNADPAGLRLLKLDSGSAGRARIMLKGSGANLPDPPLPFGQSTRLTVQLVSSTGACFEATYPSPPQLSDATRFKDVSE